MPTPTIVRTTLITPPTNGEVNGHEHRHQPCEQRDGQLPAAAADERAADEDRDDDLRQVEPSTPDP